MSNLVRFNDLPIHSVFRWGNREFLKLSNAIPNVALHKQTSNCYDLDKSHYCVFSSEHKCILIKQPSDFDDKIYEVTDA